VWTRVSDAINDVLNRMTLADLIADESPDVTREPARQLVTIGVVR
jgi:DNA-binding IscR family transcriptional regulator